MPHTNRVFANTFTYFDATLLDADYQIVDPGIPEPIYYMKIINTSTVNVFISYNGHYPQDMVLAGSSIEIYLQTNKRPKSHTALFERGRKVYVAMETNPGKSGYIYVISYYHPTI